MVDNPENKDVIDMPILHVSTAGLILTDDAEKITGYGVMLQVHPVPNETCAEMVAEKLRVLIMNDIESICKIIAQHRLAAPSTETAQ